MRRRMLALIPMRVGRVLTPNPLWVRAGPWRTSRVGLGHAPSVVNVGAVIENPASGRDPLRADEPTDRRAPPVELEMVRRRWAADAGLRAQPPLPWSQVATRFRGSRRRAFSYSRSAK